MSANNNEWQTAKTIADTLGVTPGAVTYAERNNGLVAGQHVESRLVTLADRARLDLTSQARRLYRLVPKLSQVAIDDLLADLAGCEVRIEGLEEEVARIASELSAEQDDHLETRQELVAHSRTYMEIVDEVERWGLSEKSGLAFAVATMGTWIAAGRAENAALKSECAELKKEVAEFDQVMVGIGKITGPAYDVFAGVTRLKKRRIVRRAISRVLEVVR